jgi:hypothetical protein
MVLQWKNYQQVFLVVFVNNYIINDLCSINHLQLFFIFILLTIMNHK